MERDSVSKKLDTVIVGLSELKVRFDNLEKKLDLQENQLGSLKSETNQSFSHSFERIIRLEEADKSIIKDCERSEARNISALDRIEKRFSEKLDSIQAHMNESVDKKLITLKLAMYTSLGAAALSVGGFILNALKVFGG